MNTQKTPGPERHGEGLSLDYASPILDKLQLTDRPSDRGSGEQTSSFESDIISVEDQQAQVIGAPQNVVKSEKPIFIVENLESNDDGAGDGKMLNQTDRGNFLLGAELMTETMHSNDYNSRV